MLPQQELVRSAQYRDSFKGVTLYGVAGTNGSGKDSLMNLLAEHGFLLFNTGDALREISQAVFNSVDRGGGESPVGRLGNAFRTAYPSGMTELGLLKWWARVAVLPVEMWPKGLAIGSLRGTGEVRRLKELGGKLIVVDADPRVRYDRLTKRGRGDDNITFEQFLDKEAQEMAVGQTDPAKFGMAAVIDEADIRIENNGNDIEAFKRQAAAALVLST